MIGGWIYKYNGSTVSVSIRFIYYTIKNAIDYQKSAFLSFFMIDGKFV